MSMEYDDKKDFEKGAQVTVAAVDYDDTNPDDVAIDVHSGLRDGVKRDMKQRHVQMYGKCISDQNTLDHPGQKLTSAFLLYFLFTDS